MERKYAKFIPATDLENFRGEFYYVVICTHKRKEDNVTAWLHNDCIIAQNFANYRTNDGRYRNYEFVVEERFQKPSKGEFKDLRDMTIF